MAIASGVVALVGALVVVVSLVLTYRLDPDDPKYNIGSGVAVTPPVATIGTYLGAPPGAQVLHVSVPGARRLIADQATFTKVAVVGSALQVVAVCLALTA